MGVQGLRVVRFRKRYYIYYHEFDSEPTDLGKQVAAEIPSDAAKYQQWLAVERKSAEEWETLYEDFLSIKPGNKVARGLPDFMRREHPSSLAPVNDDSIQFIYTVDLDREVFSVNNGAHFKLDQVPHIDWIGSLVNVGIGNTISLPGAVPMEAVTSLMVEHTFQSSELSKILSDPTVSEVGSIYRYCIC